ncbi:PREDICTED: mitochondrial import inner membrane translocase subunit Tim9-like [Amphimedon queenslandica]|uniref:Mitochondrial import inner membrane translocase subunit n=2 Tax=Amphimedon queenslandica TaxID=400682 RepID=A0AAN0IKP2_AMPQE|nr:PREDICTED: mitochondrial import inner membrane translocase subunit Tim9-like [Amphimedon queenslandica]|eukprot:XP_011403246.2 PREDICTED: mitochondrial import inner membrane translocase subunit Tim9-like [Amphimedon queenslandica]
MHHPRVRIKMEGLTPEQKSQLEISQFKQFLSTYNQVTESCFGDCIHDFTTRKITKDESECCSHCLDKYIKFTQRVSQRLQEHYQQTAATQ